VLSAPAASADGTGDVFKIRRRYLVALAIAAIAGVAAIVVPPIAASIRAQQARADLAAANTAFSHLRVPTDFRPLPATDTIGCLSGVRCYYVAEPTTSISKTILIENLTRIGAKYDDSNSGCFTVRPRGQQTIKQCTIYARLDGLYVYSSLLRYVYCGPTRCRRTNDSEVWISAPFTPSDD
jgi:hypothetical protein